jgi:geranylgeranylglycerol-phosphate geranylgeranyltransferase
MSHMKATALLALTRPQTTAIAAVAAVSVPGSATVPQSVAAGVVVGAICAAGFALNDYFDFTIDRISAPERPIPSGRVSRQDALTLALVLFAVGLTLSFVQGPTQFLVALSTVGLLVLYSLGMKRFGIVANAATAALCCGIFVYSGTLAGRLHDVVIVIAWLFPVVLAREMAIDIVHISGDMSANRKTAPVLVGPRATLWICRSFLVISLGWSLASFHLYAGPLVSAGLCFGALSMLLLLRSPAPLTLVTFVRRSRLLLLLLVLSWLVQGSSR